MVVLYKCKTRLELGAAYCHYGPGRSHAYDYMGALPGNCCSPSLSIASFKQMYNITTGCTCFILLYMFKSNMLPMRIFGINDVLM